MIRLRFESLLKVDAATMWRHATDMACINRELMPLLRMSSPAAFAGRSIAEAPLDQTMFHSWLLLGGVLPFDRHALRLRRVLPGVGFDEDSTSWLQRVWRHRRRIESVAGGVRVVDELEVVPRFAPAFMVRFMVTQVFAHRHRRLRAVHGDLTTAS
jgi:hypothetical protein